MKYSEEIEQFWHDFVQRHPELQAKDFFEAFMFGTTEHGADTLSALVMSGVKTATSDLLWSVEHEGRPVVQAGTYSIVMNWARRPLCVIETTEVRIIPFKDVDEAFAYDYGEGERTLAWWQLNMWDYYVQACAKIGEQATPEILIIAERFRLVP